MSGKPELPGGSKVSPSPSPTVPLTSTATSVPLLRTTGVRSTASPDSSTESLSPPEPPSETLTDCVDSTGASTSSAFETTSAKSWSVGSTLPGTPSPPIDVPPTSTEIRPVRPAGSTTPSRLLRGSAAPPGIETPPSITLPR